MFVNNSSLKIVSIVGGIGLIMGVNYIIYKKILHKSVQTSSERKSKESIKKIYTKEKSIQCEMDLSDSEELEIIHSIPQSGSKYRWFFF